VQVPQQRRLSANNADRQDDWVTGSLARRLLHATYRMGSCFPAPPGRDGRITANKTQTGYRDITNNSNWLSTSKNLLQ